MFIVWVYVDGNMVSNEKFDTRVNAENYSDALKRQGFKTELTECNSNTVRKFL